MAEGAALIELDHVLIAVSDLEAAAREMERRHGPDGTVLRWRMAGLQRSAEEASLPFFIEWGAETPYPGEALRQSAAIREVRIQGDPQRVAQWVSDANLPISVREGSPALENVVIDEAVLDPALWA